jgi:hypothetical protein
MRLTGEPDGFRAAATLRVARFLKERVRWIELRRLFNADLSKDRSHGFVEAVHSI